MAVLCVYRARYFKTVAVFPWWLGIHDPVGSHGLRQQMVELSGVGQRGELAREVKLPPSEGGVQSRQKLTPEHATKDAFGRKKWSEPTTQWLSSRDSPPPVTTQWT